MQSSSLNVIEVGMKPGFFDGRGDRIRESIESDLGIPTDSVGVIDVYTIEGDIHPHELDRLRTELFTDPVIQTSSLNAPLEKDFDSVMDEP